MKNKDKHKIIKLIKKHVEEALNERDLNIPDDYQDFDDFEFHTSAKDAAKADIEKEMGSFEDIGKNKFEKGMDSKSFAEKVKRANLKLKSDEEEVERLSKEIENTKKEKEKLEKIASKMDMPAMSLNENKRNQILAGILKNDK
jgi:DNA polymerase I-like protein with 3'-5' exonuclease and polymerase domains